MSKKTTKAGFVSGLSIEPTFAASDNMKETARMDLNFKVSPEFHKEFKVTAAQNGLKLKELLEQAFDAWKRQNR